MRYFKISEFDSPDEKGSGKNMSPLFLDFLDELTDRGYHTIKNSAHLKGLAADIAISDSVKRAYFVGHALELVHLMGLPFRLGISKKNSFIHIDIDETKTNPRMWIY